jgi:multiple antibiotic resistance protein
MPTVDWDLIRTFFIAMLAITNPLSKIPLWVKGSEGEDEHVRWRLALLVTLTAFAILLVFLVGGRWFLDLFGIDLASFRVGGGIILLLVGLDMLRGKVVQLDPDAEEGSADTRLHEAQARFKKVAVPLAVPIMAGPGSISTAVVYSSEVDSLLGYAGLAGALAVVMVILFLVLLSGQRVERTLGATTLDIQTRVFGMILAGIGVQLMVEGLGAIFPAWLTEGSTILEDLRDGP